ncbi:MAG: hypothetical protein AAF533_00110 [Acidobacteriota bacterium]
MSSDKRGCWVACGVGCLLFLVLVVGGCTVLYLKVLKPTADAAQRIEEAAKRQRAAQRELEALDEQHPSPWADDALGAVEITPELVDRYVVVRAELGPPMAAFAQSETEGEDGPSGLFGFIKSMGSVIQETGASPERAALAEQAARSLGDQQLGPAHFDQLLRVVEHRFLDHPEAWLGALSPTERVEQRLTETQLGLIEELKGVAESFGSSPDETRDMEEQIEKLETRLAEIRDKAATADRAMSPATVQVLESRRSELEGLPGQGLEALFALRTWDHRRQEQNLKVDWGSTEVEITGPGSGEAEDAAEQQE